MTDDYVIRIKKYDQQDYRLGRNVVHDSRSLQYQVDPLPRESLVSMVHLSNIPILDQGNYFDPTTRTRISLGSCTGNAGTANLSYGDFWPTALAYLSTVDTDFNEEYAVQLYSAATAIDPWEGTYPPDDTGSNGLSIAKVLQRRGVISGYQHATSLDAVLTALQTQAVIVGTEWRSDMFHPDSDGRLRITGSVAGGHEYVLDAVDVQNRRVWMRNSWGVDWGLSGRAWFTWDDFATLLAADGDCTVFVPVSQPAPTPTPTPVPVDPADAALSTAAKKWLGSAPFFYKKFQADLGTWLDSKGLR